MGIIHGHLIPDYFKLPIIPANGRAMIRHHSKMDIIRELREHDIMPTHQRIEIFKVLFAKPQHLSADQVLEKVNKYDAHVSKATVYNTLGLFARKGLIREVIVDPSKIFYDPTTTPHHHIYNVDTGTLLDIDAEELNMGNIPPPPAGTHIEGIDVVIRVRSLNDPLPADGTTH
jgi:Fur family iron response transcriptional regulator